MFFSKKKREIRKERARREMSMKSLFSNYSPATRYAEAYRTLRTNLHFAVRDRELTSLVVTSSVQEEGKTNTAINLGHTISETGKKVLLVDGDLRKPMLTDIFALKQERGMVDLISDVMESSISRGDLSQYTISDLMQLIKYQKRTGILNIRSEEDEVSFYFIHGRITDLLWHNRPDEKKLINVLLKKKLLKPEEVQLGLLTKRKTGRKVGAIFHSMGIVSAEDLKKILSVQAVEVIRVAATIQDGEFTFVSAQERDIRSAFAPDMGFEDIFKEFFGHDDENSFINRNINEMIHSTDSENLFVIGAGKQSPNPAELIASDRTDFIVECLKRKFDFVIIDTPPVVPATDALVMAPRTDGTLLVVRSGHTNKKLVKDVVERYRRAGLPLLGVLLNRVNMKKEGYYYRYYQKYYASYYGE